MDKQQAVSMLQELIASETNVCNRPSKKAEKREDKAVRVIFLALTGVEPSGEEIKQMVSS